MSIMLYVSQMQFRCRHFQVVEMLTLFVVLKLAVSAVILSAFLRSLAQCIRNIFFHPYAKYPGPFLARITPLYSLWHAYIGDLHLDALRCHEEYGEFHQVHEVRLSAKTNAL